MRRRALVLVAALGILLPAPVRPAPPDEPEVVDGRGNRVVKGNRLRVDPASGDRFVARYLLREGDSLRVVLEDERTVTLPVEEIDRLEVYRGSRERVHPFLYVMGAAAFVAGGVMAYRSTEDSSALVQVLATLGGGMAGMWLMGTMIPHGGGMQRVEIWIRVPLDP